MCVINVTGEALTLKVQVIYRYTWIAVGRGAGCMITRSPLRNMMLCLQRLGLIGEISASIGIMVE
jgi:hypothetical protein